MEKVNQVLSRSDKYLNKSPSLKDNIITDTSKNINDIQIPLVREYSKTENVFIVQAKDVDSVPVSPRIQKKNYDLSSMKIIKQLGEGKFSEVFLCCDKETNFLFALKKIKKTTINQYKLTQDIINEIKSQALLDHPNLIKLYGFFVDYEAIYLIQELGHGKELFADLKSQPNKRFKEVIAANYIRQIIQALIYMHQKKFIHRDIKLENIMLTNGVLKLCDFGYATALEEDQMRKTFCGTLDYASPEMIEGKEYDHMVDAWSIGILTYELIFGQAPFTEKNDKEKTFQNIVNNQIGFPGLISFEGVDFIKKLLNKNPQDRMNLQEALNHPFIINGMTSRQNQSELEFSDIWVLD